MDRDEFLSCCLFVFLGFAVLGVAVAGLFGIEAVWSKYNVWSSALAGEAELKKSRMESADCGKRGSSKDGRS